MTDIPPLRVRRIKEGVSMTLALEPLWLLAVSLARGDGGGFWWRP
jgi:hypothetical protein